MCSQKIRRYSLVTALLIGGCVSASASVTVFTDRTLWTTATANVVNIDFEGIAAANAVVQYDGSPDRLTIGSTTFQGFDQASSGLDLEVNNDISPNWGTGAVLQGPAPFSSNSRLVATVGAGIFAVGSDVFALNGSDSDSGTVNMVLSIDGTVYHVNTIAGFSSHAFVGFVSDTAINSITFFPPSPDRVIIDNFATGGQLASNPAPEAATMIMCGSGILLMVWLFRRNRNYVLQGSAA
jgi:hypothetical protein